jgi:heme exporter protein B
MPPERGDGFVAKKLYWMVSKDLLAECRSLRVWPAMLLLGAVVALMFAMQADLPAARAPGTGQEERVPGAGSRQIAGGLLWLTIFFAGTLALDRSFAAEHEDGCWEGLLCYPVSPTTVYLAKLTVNIIALSALECVLIPLFAMLTGAPLLAYPGPIVAVAVLGNLGIAAVGTLLSAVANTGRQSSYLLPLLVLPTIIPLVLGAAEATRLAAEHDFGPAWWRWVQLLGAFAIIFITAGIGLFEFAIEE